MLCKIMGLEQTTLEGICPDEITDTFVCSGTSIKTLKGCPKKIGNCAYLSNNSNLKDISDLPTDVEQINIYNCPKIKVFTNNITTKDRSLLFVLGFRQTNLIKRIKAWPCYEVEYISRDTDYQEYFIRVNLKQDNEVYMNSL